MTKAELESKHLAELHALAAEAGVVALPDARSRGADRAAEHSDCSAPRWGSSSDAFCPRLPHGQPHCAQKTAGARVPSTPARPRRGFNRCRRGAAPSAAAPAPLPPSHQARSAPPRSLAAAPSAIAKPWSMRRIANAVPRFCVSWRASWSRRLRARIPSFYLSIPDPRSWPIGSAKRLRPRFLGRSGSPRRRRVGPGGQSRPAAGEDVILLIDSLTRLAEAYGDTDSSQGFFDAGRDLWRFWRPAH